MGRYGRVLAAAVLCHVTTACASPVSSGGAEPLRLGYFANLTHATAMVAVDRGFLEASLGPHVPLRTQVFTAGPAVVEAIFGGSVDAAYLGPSPAINAYVRSEGRAIRIIAGATSGGASLVVRPSIGSVEELRGRTVATPQLGNTQDVALRFHLMQNGLRTEPQGGGDVKIAPVENATTLDLFRQGKIDGAWLPEPWATRLSLDAGGRRLIDETTLWPGGRFSTTVLVVSTRFGLARRDVVKRLMAGHLAATRWIGEHPGEAKAVVNASIERLTQRGLSGPVMDEAWSRLEITADPIASSLEQMASNARAVGLLDDADLGRIFDLGRE